MIIIFCKHLNNRIVYTLETIFTDILNIQNVVITNNYDDFINSSCPAKINYSSEYISHTFTINPNTTLLSETVINNYYPEFKIIDNNITVPFVCTEKGHLKFDIFSAVFYIITRYEEYTNPKKDKHGRFPHTESILHKNNLLQHPVINIWCEYLLDNINRFYQLNICNNATFKSIFTMDVDIAYAYKHKTPRRNFLSIIKKLLLLKFNELSEQFKVINNKQKDPYDTYEYFIETLSANKIKPVIFFLLGDTSKHNINLSYKNQEFKKLIKSLSQKTSIGIHPSYNSSHKKTIIEKEIERLKNITGQRVKKSRQHYLKFSLPETYEYLLSSGITEDYSMGYANCLGFRAGTCSAHRWFNLKTNEPTELIIYPVSVMDGTLNEYLKLNTEQAISESKKIIHTIKKYKGCFIPLWHNNTLSDTGIWKGWRRVFEEQINECK